MIFKKQKLNNLFFSQMEDKKWKERKEAMEILLPLSQNPRLEPGDYHELMKGLKKVKKKTICFWNNKDQEHFYFKRKKNIISNSSHN